MCGGQSSAFGLPKSLSLFIYLFICLRQGLSLKLELSDSVRFSGLHIQGSFRIYNNGIPGTHNHGSFFIWGLNIPAPHLAQQAFYQVTSLPIPETTHFLHTNHNLNQVLKTIDTRIFDLFKYRYR